MKKINQKKEFTARVRIFLAIVSVCVISSGLLSENRMILRLAENNTIQIDLYNTDYIEGSQFTVNARGGLTLGRYENGDRASTSGFELYQYLVNDSTLNVVILAPYHSPLGPGHGVIGSMHFTLQTAVSADSATVFVSNAKFSDDNANLVQVSTASVVWNLHQDFTDIAPSFSLEQNYPNPFNPSTNIAYTLKAPAQVTLAIYDITGRRVRSLVNQYQLEGLHTIQWSAEGHQGPALTSGVYIARLQVSNQVATRKMIYAK